MVNDTVNHTTTTTIVNNSSSSSNTGNSNGSASTSTNPKRTLPSLPPTKQRIREVNPDIESDTSSINADAASAFSHQSNSTQSSSTASSASDDQHGSSLLPTTGLWEMRQKIVTIIDSLDTSKWKFQPDVDKKARNHLRNLMFNEWTYIQTLKSKQPAKHMNLKKVKDLDSLIKHFHKKQMKFYKKWCLGSFQKPKQAKDVFNDFATTEQKLVADMLLLLMVWGEIDILRSQNNICLLLFHASKVFIQTNGEGRKKSKSQIAKKEKKYTKWRKFGSVGDMLRFESMYLFEMCKKVGFNRNLRNEHFVAWDDLNTMCWTKPFVEKFCKWFSFQMCFRLHSKQHMAQAIQKQVDEIVKNWSEPEQFQPLTDDLDFNVLIAKSNESSTREPIAVEEAEDDANKGATEEDRTSDASSSHPQQTIAAIQISSRSTKEEKKAEAEAKKAKKEAEKEEKKKASEQKKKEALQKKEQQKVKKERNAFVRTWKTYFDRAGGPFGIIGYLTMFHNFSLAIYAQLLIFSISLFVFLDFPYFDKIINQPMLVGILIAPPVAIGGLLLVAQIFLLFWYTKPMLHPYKLWLPQRGAFSFRIGNLLNYVIWLLVFGSQIFVVRYLVFDILYKAAMVLFDQLSQQQYDYMSMVAYFVSWVPVFFVYWTITPILFTLWKTLFGFIYSLILRVNRITSWRGFKKCMRSDQTLKHFQKKLLGIENRDLDMDDVRYRFAYLFNAMIKDFYEDHLCSFNQLTKLSFDLAPFDQTKKIPKEDYKNQVTAITTVTPKNQELAYYLMKFMNNLYLGMPHSKGIEAMRKLVIVTPVYKETVVYSWSELVEVQNTDMSFLSHLIKKHPYDWKNFRETQSVEYQTLLLALEEKVKSAIDIKNHYVPYDLVKKIRFWASMRFQSVARTVQGMMKVPKAFKVLLKVQTFQKGYTDEQINEIVKDKFMFVIGAQCMDKATWSASDKLEQYVKDFLELLSLNPDFMRVCYQKNVGHNRWKGVLLKKDTRTDSVIEEYGVNVYGRFDNKGQGKPAHQAFMMQFFDGSVVETIDCNQAGNIGQYFFMPNAIKVFDKKKDVKILGFPEYIFTEHWSLAGYSAAFIEKVFGSMVQKSWNLLGLRLHYGHPDLMDGLWVMFVTGLSNMNYVSEDIFTGFDTLLNGGKVDYIEFMEVGKARDVCLFSTSKFNRKTAGGAAQVACSRYINELMFGFKLNMAEKITLFYTSISHYYNTTIVVVSTYLVFFFRIVVLILRLASQQNITDKDTAEVWRALDVVFIIQLGLTLCIPGFFLIILDKGFFKGIYEYVFKGRVFLVSLYSIFHLLHTALFFHFGFKDAAQYIASGRGAGLSHESIGKIVVSFDTSHFVPAFVLLILGIVGFVLSLGESVFYFIYVLFIAAIWLWSPFFFNRGSFPLDVGYETWVKLYAKDLDYILKWKVRHIISEIFRRKKDVKKVEKHQEELIERSAAFEKIWIPDLEAIDEEKLEANARGVPEIASPVAEQLKRARDSIADLEDYALTEEYDFKFKEEKAPVVKLCGKESKFLGFLKQKFFVMKIYLSSMVWNGFLLVTLTGIKYVTLLLTVIQFLNPFAIPFRRTVEVADLQHKNNEKRFFKIQQYIREVQNRIRPKQLEDDVRKLKAQLEDMQKKIKI